MQDHPSKITSAVYVILHGIGRCYKTIIPVRLCDSVTVRFVIVDFMFMEDKGRGDLPRNEKTHDQPAR